jgi:hypothetical protein
MRADEPIGGLGDAATARHHPDLTQVLAIGRDHYQSSNTSLNSMLLPRIFELYE